MLHGPLNVKYFHQAIISPFKMLSNSSTTFHDIFRNIDSVVKKTTN
jgi:hypothetical protein